MLTQGTVVRNYPYIISNDISPYLIERFEAVGTQVKYAKNAPIVLEGEIADSCYYLTKGNVIITQRTLKDPEILFIFSTGVLMSSAHALFDEMLPYSSHAYEPVEAIRVMKDDIWPIIDEDSVIARFAIENMACLLVSMRAKLYEKCNHSETWRICRLFDNMVDVYGVEVGGEIKINFKFSQQFVSDMLSISRITVVRRLKSLKEQNILDFRGGYYYVTDIKALQYILVMEM